MPSNTIKVGVTHHPTDTNVAQLRQRLPSAKRNRSLTCIRFYNQLVLRVTLPVCPSDPTLHFLDTDPERSDLGENVREVWLHLSLLYESPWRPTFTQLKRRSPTRADEGAIPLALVDAATDGSPSQPKHLSLWEFVSYVDMTKAITARCFRLHGPDLKAVLEVEPWKQRVLPLALGDRVFWRGLEFERAKRLADQAKRARKRPRPAPKAAVAAPLGAAAVLDGPGGDAAGADAEAEVDDDNDLEMLLDDSAAEDEGWVEMFGEAMGDPFALPADVAGDGAPPGPADAAIDAPAVAPDGDSGSGSSSGRSSSSSSSSSSGAAAGGVAADEVAVALAVVIPGSDLKGQIHITELGDRREMYAVCPCKGTHGACIKTRTCNPGRRRGQGRPLGYLAAWLRESTHADLATKADHMAFTPSVAQRRAARASLVGADDVLRYTAFERPREAGEGSEPDEFV